MTDRDPWHFIAKFPSKCCAETSRAGESQPCDKPTYAVAADDGRYWPVCIHHARGQFITQSSICPACFEPRTECEHR